MSRLGSVARRGLDWAFRQGRRIPGFERGVERRFASLLDAASERLHPYRDEIEPVVEIPEHGRARTEVLDVIEELSARERDAWESGRASGAVYHGDPEHVAFLNRVYALASQSNPLHVDLWPSIAQFEAEIVAMTAHLLGAAPAASGAERVSGSVTSGGTESILLAMKAYRDAARARSTLRTPEIVAPTSAHAAFEKAAETLGMRLISVPVAADYRADAGAMARAITRRTAVLVGSAPCFPHGVIDPIARLSEIAVERGVGLHVDACLGGFVLPWAAQLGYPVPAFDFRLPGVSSMSADTHKYGYAAKGSSVVLYRSAELRRHQYFVITDWPGGLYFSPTFAGSRPGALSAACWAALVSIGRDGYLDSTRRILDTARQIRDGIAAIPGLSVLGDPLWVIAFAAEGFDVYRVLEAMNARGWSLNGLQRPPSLHVCVTLRHAQPGVVERFLDDLRASVDHVRATPHERGTLAPIYGTASTFPVRGAIAELLRRYIDRLYEP